MRTAHVSRMGDPGQCQVVDEMTPFCYEPMVLGALERLGELWSVDSAEAHSIVMDNFRVLVAAVEH